MIISLMHNPTHPQIGGDDRQIVSRLTFIPRRRSCERVTPPRIYVTRLGSYATMLRIRLHLLQLLTTSYHARSILSWWRDRLWIRRHLIQTHHPRSRLSCGRMRICIRSHRAILLPTTNLNLLLPIIPILSGWTDRPGPISRGPWTQKQSHKPKTR